MPTPIALRPDKDDDRRTLPARHQLYQRLLGASFERLPDTLRRFHAGPGGTAEFAMEVTYEPGFLRTVLSALLRLPKPSPRAPGKLVVTVRDDREVWERVFPDTKLHTVHWIDGDHLVEEAGPLQFVFDVDANERGLRFSSIACRFLGFAMPRWLVPRIEAAARADERGWNLLVSIAVPVLGRLATYGGPVTPLP